MPTMPPQDALEAIFEEIVKLYEKICEIDTDLLKIDGITEIFDDRGGFVFLSPSFDPVDTDGNPGVEAALRDKINDLNSYFLGRISAASSTNTTSGLSDVELLKLSEKKLQINALIESINNLPTQPAKLAEIVSERILAIKELASSSVEVNVIQINEIKELFSLEGNLIPYASGDIVINNPDNLGAIVAAQLYLDSIWQNFKTFIRRYIDSFPVIAGQNDLQRIGLRTEMAAVLYEYTFLFQGRDIRLEKIEDEIKSLIAQITNLVIDHKNNTKTIKVIELSEIFDQDGKLTQPQTAILAIDNPGQNPEIAVLQEKATALYNKFLDTLDQVIQTRIRNNDQPDIEVLGLKKSMISVVNNFRFLLKDRIIPTDSLQEQLTLFITFLTGQIVKKTDAEIKIIAVSDAFGFDGSLMEPSTANIVLENQRQESLISNLQDRVNTIYSEFLTATKARVSLIRNGSTTQKDIEVLGFDVNMVGNINFYRFLIEQKTFPIDNLSVQVNQFISLLNQILFSSRTKTTEVEIESIIDLFNARGNLNSPNSEGIKLKNPNNDPQIASIQTEANSLFDGLFDFLNQYLGIFQRQPNQSDEQVLGLVTGFTGVINGLKFGLIGKKFLADLFFSLINDLIKDFIKSIIYGRKDEECEYSLIYPGEQFEHQKITTQLSLTMVLSEPENDSEKCSKWHINLPSPKPCEDLDWERDFAPLQRTLGSALATVKYKNHSGKTYAYFKDEAEAEQFLTKLVTLTTLEPISNANEKIYRLSLHGKPKRNPRERKVKVKYATWVQFDDNAQPTKVYRFKEP
jgi:hypothetical protein